MAPPSEYFLYPKLCLETRTDFENHKRFMVQAGSSINTPRITEGRDTKKCMIWFWDVFCLVPLDFLLGQIKCSVCSG